MDLQVYEVSAAAFTSAEGGPAIKYNADEFDTTSSEIRLWIYVMASFGLCIHCDIGALELLDLGINASLHLCTCEPLSVYAQ